MIKRKVLLVAILAVLIIAKGLFAATVEPNLHVAVVLDSSPASSREWDMIKSQLLEAVHALKSGDALDVLIAKPGKPKVLVSTIITESHSLQRDQVTELVSGLPKELLFGADFAKALQTANDRLKSTGSIRHQCLIILTNGRRGDSQVEKIREWARAFRSNNWPVCITCDQRRANRDLLTAASLKEFDVRFLTRPLLSDWINEVRNRFTIKQDSPPEKIDPSSDLTSSDFFRLLGRVKDPVKVQIVNPEAIAQTPPQGEVPSETPVIAKTPPKEPEETIPEIPEEPVDQPKHPIPLLAWVMAGLLVAGIFVLGIAWLLRRLPRDKRDYETDTTDEKISGPEHLIAYFGEERQDLGEQSTLKEILIGRQPGSTILLDYEGIQDCHLIIVKKRKKLIVQNCADEPVIVNGMEITTRAKAELILPAEVIMGEVQLSLQNETIDLDMEEESDETA